ncbi:RNA methyltransferase tRNA(m5U54)methyltransferase, partial [Spiromyces aspiralis]
QGKQFDVVDLDPYGSAVPFIDGAIQAVKNGGLICVTCTDLAVLASVNHPETCFAKYGGSPLRAEFCHELALRLVVHCLQSSAARYKRFVVPVLSCSIDFYVRLFVRVYDSAERVKSVASNTGIVYHCPNCRSFEVQPMGTVTPQKNGNFKYSVASGPITEPVCKACGTHTHVGGPCWIGPLHDKSFVQKMYDHVADAKDLYKTQPRMKGMLKVIHEELDIPFHYTVSAMSSAVRTSCPSLIDVSSAILNAGYKVSGVHSCSGALKTDTPASVMWDIFRAWVEKVGRSKKVQEGSFSAKILDQPIRYSISTSQRLCIG